MTERLSLTETDIPTVDDRLRAFAKEFHRRYEDYLKPVDDVPETLSAAMRYSALAPGKRIRPYLVVRCCEVVGGCREDAWPVAAAVECVHAFSLIHDDLPAMDDDDLRRGQPTCHKKFGEAVALLAGDALLVFAFDLLSRLVADRSLAADLVEELSRGTGWSGMIGGQTADVLGESRDLSMDLVRYIHERKTASLFESACRLGARVGRGDLDSISLLGRFGQMLGRSFQIADDLLDVTSTTATMGKSVAKDARSRKQTYPQCVGLEASRSAANEVVRAAIEMLSPFGEQASDLRALARYAVERDS